MKYKSYTFYSPANVRMQGDTRVPAIKTDEFVFMCNINQNGFIMTIATIISSKIVGTSL